MALWDPVAGTLLDPLDGVEDSLFFVGPDRLAAVWHGQPGVYDYQADKMVVSAGPGAPVRRRISAAIAAGVVRGR